MHLSDCSICENLGHGHDMQVLDTIFNIQSIVLLYCIYISIYVYLFMDIYSTDIYLRIFMYIYVYLCIFMVIQCRSLCTSSIVIQYSIIHLYKTNSILIHNDTQT